MLQPLNDFSGVDVSSIADASEDLAVEQYETLEPRRVVCYDQTEVIFATPNVATRWRVDTLFSKEPETIDWIAGFQPGDVLVDIGANVGLYTIWAAKTRGVRVYAFEPESQNYALLYRNIVLNQLSKQVVAYCVALSDEPGYSLLHLNQFEAGRSNHSYGEEVDYKLEYRESQLSQGCVATTLDLLVTTGAVPRPNHIKIDVDGFEHKVLTGCANLLADKQLASLLIEINTNLEQHRKIVTEIQGLGFTYSEEQVARALRTE
ncbi:MAG TPA: FkbM family methyltransferase, partial [Pyrinomonadaceae bacterium]|nr:FkbM family methyltransferase [Pyrinomonadaceae bacterium]